MTPYLAFAAECLISGHSELLGNFVNVMSYLQTQSKATQTNFECLVGFCKRCAAARKTSKRKGRKKGRNFPARTAFPDGFGGRFWMGRTRRERHLGGMGGPSSGPLAQRTSSTTRWSEPPRTPASGSQRGSGDISESLVLWALIRPSPKQLESVPNLSSVERRPNKQSPLNLNEPQTADISRSLPGFSFRWGSSTAAFPSLPPTPRLAVILRPDDTNASKMPRTRCRNACWQTSCGSASVGWQQREGHLTWSLAPPSLCRRELPCPFAFRLRLIPVSQPPPKPPPPIRLPHLVAATLARYTPLRMSPSPS